MGSGRPLQREDVRGITGTKQKAFQKYKQSGEGADWETCKNKQNHIKRLNSGAKSNIEHQVVRQLSAATLAGSVPARQERRLAPRGARGHGDTAHTTMGHQKGAAA